VHALDNSATIRFSTMRSPRISNIGDNGVIEEKNQCTSTWVKINCFNCCKRIKNELLGSRTRGWYFKLFDSLARSFSKSDLKHVFFFILILFWLFNIFFQICYFIVLKVLLYSRLILSTCNYIELISSVSNCLMWFIKIIFSYYEANI